MQCSSAGGVQSSACICAMKLASTCAYFLLTTVNTSGISDEHDAAPTSSGDGWSGCGVMLVADGIGTLKGFSVPF